MQTNIFDRKIPLWTSYHLASTDTSFKPDHDLLVVQRSELSDYKGSGYDRGHMVPSVDMKKNYNAMKESYLLSNIVPQNPSCNRGIWRIIESKAREMAIKYREVWIITGPPPYFVSNEKHAGGQHISIDYIEVLTGLDFLSKLPDDVEEKIEKGLPER